MNERIWEDEITYEKIEEKVNDYIAQEIRNVQRNGLLEKWNYFSILTMESDDVITKFIEVVKYIDELSIEKDTKIEYILTFTYLLLKEKLDILKMDTNNLFLLISYLNDVPLEKITSELQYANNETLLETIRLKTLDIDVRRRLLKFAAGTKKQLAEICKWIQETEYYELLKYLERSR